MNQPQGGDYIDIHNHGSEPVKGVFQVETLLAHEGRLPDSRPGITYTAGIHPWHLKESTLTEDLNFVRDCSRNDNVIAIGEAGFDRIKGAEPALQEDAFGKQVKIAGDTGKPLFIHCVRGWDELLAAQKKFKPEVPWIVHGYRGKKEHGLQLVARGFYLSIWFEYALLKDSADLVRHLPADRLFLETDGSGADIREIYRKIAADLEMDVELLKGLIYRNYCTLFNKEH